MCFFTSNLVDCFGVTLITTITHVHVNAKIFITGEIQAKTSLIGSTSRFKPKEMTAQMPHFMVQTNTYLYCICLKDACVENNFTEPQTHELSLLRPRGNKTILMLTKNEIYPAYKCLMSIIIIVSILTLSAA